MRGYCLSRISLVLAAAFALCPLAAQAKDDLITLDLGAYLFRSRDNINVGGPTIRGTQFRLEREGTPDNDTVLRVDGTIRPFERHRIRFMFMDSTREGDGLIDRNISFRDVTYNIGSRVNSSFRLTETELDYLYSFWKTDDWEWAVSLGVHLAQMKATLTAPQLNLSQTADLNGPVPMIGLAGNWTPNEKWEVFGHVYGMSASVRDYSGTAVAYRVGGRYYFTDHLGVGLAWAGIRYNLDVNRTAWLGSLDASHAGGQLFLTFRY